MNLDTYKGELTCGLTEAWSSLARDQVKKAQKKFYDRKSRDHTFREGDRVFVYMPKEKTSKAYKFARPFHGPYQVIESSWILE